MNHLIKTNSLPTRSKLHVYCIKINYCDSYAISYNKELQIEDITYKIFTTPSWVDVLLKIRDFIVKPFGLQTSDKMFEKNQNEANDLNKKLPFPLVEVTDNEIVMHENDKHLKFWVSVMLSENMVYLTTVVQYNNVWGKLYFAFVKPFHVLIIRSIMKKI